MGAVVLNAIAAAAVGAALSTIVGTAVIRTIVGSCEHCSECCINEHFVVEHCVSVCSSEHCSIPARPPLSPSVRSAESHEEPAHRKSQHSVNTYTSQRAQHSVNTPVTEPSI